MTDETRLNAADGFQHNASGISAPTTQVQAKTSHEGVHLENIIQNLSMKKNALDEECVKGNDKQRGDDHGANAVSEKNGPTVSTFDDVHVEFEPTLGRSRRESVDSVSQIYFYLVRSQIIMIDNMVQ